MGMGMGMGRLTVPIIPLAMREPKVSNPSESKMPESILYNRKRMTRVKGIGRIKKV